MAFETSRNLKIGASALVLGLAALQASPVLAQDTDAAASDEDDSDTDEIVVIGVGTNISGVKPVGSQAIVLDQEDIAATGMTTPADVVRTLPQVRNLGEFREGGTQGGNNSQQGNAINLRGLGAAATLVLVDGRRVVATGASANFTEANQVPLAALSSIEVITDGASAIYGSDAIAGVVNYVLRKDFDGVETSFRMSNNNGGWEYTPGVTAGTHWNIGGREGNVIVAYEYTHRDPYLRGENKWLRQDLRPVGGPDQRINGATGSAGSPGNIVVATPGVNNTTIPLAGTNVYYGLPASATGLGITVDQLALNDPNLIDTADFTDYTGRVERHQVSAFFNQEITDGLGFFAQASYNNRHTYSRQISSFLGSIENVTVPQFLYDPVTNTPDFSRPNPAFIAGIPGVGPDFADGSSDITVQYNFFDSSGFQNWDNKVKSYNVTGGFEFDLFGGWKGEAYYTHGFDDACNFCALGTNINPDSLQYMINTGEINPLSTAPLTDDQLDRLFGDNIQQSGNKFDDIVAKFDGPLFDWAAGTVRAAFGGEYTKQANWNVNGRNKGIDNVLVIDTDKERSIGTRSIYSVYGEIYAPLVGPEMDIPGVQEFVIDAAVRYDDYSDVGSTTNPKVGVTWDVIDEITLRGSWGTSFRAPGLPDINPSAISGAFVFDPFPNNSPDIANDFCVPGVCLTTFGLLYGANPDIGPEKATTWSIGVDFRPVDRLRLSGTYYSIKYSDRIVQPAFSLIGLFLNPGYPTYGGYDYAIIPINNTNVTGPDTCTLDPALADILGRPILYGTTLTNPCFLNVVADGRTVNLAATKQDGIDAQIDYTIPITDGAVNLSLAVNKVLNNKQQVTPGAEFVDVLNRADQPIEWRGRGSVGAMWKGFTATLFANYVGSYDNLGAVDPETNLSIGTQKVDSWTTFDLTLGYMGSLNSFLKDYRASVTIQNLFDSDPPLMITSNGAFNASYSNPYGRTFTFQIGASF